MKHRTSTSRDHPSSGLEGHVELPISVVGHSGVGAVGATTLITNLPYGPNAADLARKAVSVALHDAEADLLEDARLITSELATNAFASGSPPLVLCVYRKGQTSGGLEVEITITDGGCSHPVAPSSPIPCEEAESGRGLVIIGALTDAWSLTTSANGSRAWCRLTREPPSRTCA